MDAQQLLQAGKLQEALQAAQQELVDHPRDIDALYCMAVSQRYLGQLQAALQTLETLKAVRPNYARAWQEEGPNQKKLGDLDSARNAYRHAVELNRGLISSWRELAAIHDKQHDKQRLAIAKAEFERLSRLPPELVTVTSLIHETSYSRPKSSVGTSWARRRIT